MCVACQIPIADMKIKFAEWDTKAVCLNCWGELPLDIRKQVNQYSTFEKKAREQEQKKLEASESRADLTKSTNSVYF